MIAYTFKGYPSIPTLWRFLKPGRKSTQPFKQIEKRSMYTAGFLIRVYDGDSLKDRLNSKPIGNFRVKLMEKTAEAAVEVWV